MSGRCPVCGDTGERRFPMGGRWVGTVTVGCDCPAGTAWNERHAGGFKALDWGDNPPPRGESTDG